VKIYSYYDNIKFDNQKELVSLWKISWEKQGFIPIVLSSDDAKKNTYYEEFVTKLKYIHKEITGKELQQYGLSCYLRWLAYANQNEIDCFLMSDYDVINRNFEIDDIKIESNEMNFLDRYCPCLAYGNSQSCFRFCKDIVDHSYKFKQNIIEEYKKNNCVWYHDQEFLVINHEKLKCNILTSYVDLYNYGIESGKQQLGSKLFHVAHRSIGEAKSQYKVLKNVDGDQLRINFVKKILNETTCELTLGLDVPSCFNAEKYEKLYNETKDYYGEKYEKKQRLYDHYLKFGKQSGFAFNHKSLPVFYHMAKCGGIYVHNNIILPNLYAQYCTLSSNNDFYNIAILHNNSKILHVLARSLNKDFDNKLQVKNKIQDPVNPDKILVDAQISYSKENMIYLTNNFEVLSIIVEPNGLAGSDNYINLLVSDKNIDKIILLRRPINKTQSLFYYLRDVGNWESTSKVHQNMSFCDYVNSDLISDSWIIREIVNLSKEQPITEEDYIKCQKYLEKFKHIGFLEHIEDTIDFFKNEYNWSVLDLTKQNENKVSKKEPVSQDVLDKLNYLIYYDNKLYDYFYKKSTELYK
jgi:hypothetical protein